MAMPGSGSSLADGGFRGTPDWRSVSARLWSGVYHELVGRTTTVASLLGIARMDGKIDEGAFERIDAELDRLNDTIALIRLLHDEPETEPEAVAVAELLSNLVTLHRLHRGLETVEVRVRRAPGDASVTRAHRATLCGLLLLLLGAASRTARATGSDAVTASVGEGGPGRVVVAVEPKRGVADSGEADGRTELPPRLDADALRRACEIARAMRGDLDYRLDDSGRPTTFELRLPVASASAGTGRPAPGPVS